ncbi:MAG: hypothetical protein LAO78_17465 [Acidobacteriia bacterium]|nr:hypothetical protein [Terriglobia bacterium]
MMKRFLQSALLAMSFAAFFLPSAAQARTYDVVTATVPFTFNIGDRAFRPGRYQFILVGPGLLALRDTKTTHIVASLVTRAVETEGPLPSSKLVFHREKKRQRLTQIWIEKHTQVIEVVGEELAMRQPAQPQVIPLEGLSFSGRQDTPRFKY